MRESVRACVCGARVACVARGVRGVRNKPKYVEGTQEVLNNAEHCSSGVQRGVNVSGGKRGVDVPALLAFLERPMLSLLRVETLP